MQHTKKRSPKEKHTLHPRNRYQGSYDFKALIACHPELKVFVKWNEYQNESIDFSDPKAVKALNTSLLKHYYDIDNWDIPLNYLCPPIPGRADYIHYIADLLAGSFSQSTGPKIPTGNKITCLDIGVGANCVYPIIGVKEYGWSFIGSDIDPVAMESAKRIVAANPFLKDRVDLRLQKNPKDIFNGIIKKGEFIDVSMCNPPFHASPEEAQAGTIRKVNNLKNKKTSGPVLNFGGQQNELWCSGGEERFVRNMIFESKQFAEQCRWFTTLISKQAHLKRVYNAMERVEAVEIKTIPMGQGNKISRMVAWTFLNTEQWQQRKTLS